MWKKIKNGKTSINRNESYEGERIETKIERILTNNEPIKDGAPLIYTERADGVRAEYNIRTDRFEIALDAMDAVARTTRSKRDNIVKMEAKDSKKDGGAESIEATNNDSVK